MKKSFLFLFLLGLLFFSNTLVHAAPPAKNAQTDLNRLDKVMRQLEQLEKDQALLLESQKATIEEIKNLKIISRKS